jgi:hypothetical protein
MTQAPMTSSGGNSSIVDYLGKVAPFIPIVGVATGMLVFLGRLYLESYYGYFGIPASALNFEVQDYTFGSFPLVIFVLVVLIFHFFYIQISKNRNPAEMISRVVNDRLETLIDKSNEQRHSQMERRRIFQPLRDDIKHKFQLTRRSTRSSGGLVKSGVFLQGYFRLGVVNIQIQSPYILIGLAYFSIYLAIGLFFVIAAAGYYLTFAGIFGSGFSSAELGINWDSPNIPGLRGLISGTFAALGALMVTTLIKFLLSLFNSPESENVDDSLVAFNPVMVADVGDPTPPSNSRQVRSFYTQMFTVILVLASMPTATHFMARDQAKSDLLSPVDRFQTRMQTARIRVPLENAIVTEWEWNCAPTELLLTAESKNEGVASPEPIPVFCNSPHIRIVLINDGMLYAIVVQKTNEGNPSVISAVPFNANTQVEYQSPLPDEDAPA